jgi:hypothetical protein
MEGVWRCACLGKVTDVSQSGLAMIHGWYIAEFEQYGWCGNMESIQDVLVSNARRMAFMETSANLPWREG